MGWCTIAHATVICIAMHPPSCSPQERTCSAILRSKFDNAVLALRFHALRSLIRSLSNLLNRVCCCCVRNPVFFKERGISMLLLAQYYEHDAPKFLTKVNKIKRLENKEMCCVRYSFVPLCLSTHTHTHWRRPPSRTEPNLNGFINIATK